MFQTLYSHLVSSHEVVILKKHCYIVIVGRDRSRVYILLRGDITALPSSRVPGPEIITGRYKQILLIIDIILILFFCGVEESIPGSVLYGSLYDFPKYLRLCFS